MTIIQGLAVFSNEEIRRWLHLRAIEWTGLPAFCTQPLVPVLFIFFDWWKVLLSLLLISFIWILVRYRIYNYTISNFFIFFVKLKWFSAIGVAVYFSIEKNYLIAVLALLWPFLSGIIGIPGQIGKVELMISKHVGYVDENKFSSS